MTIQETDATKTTISPKNFGAQNTPPNVEKIGNYMLLAGAIGTAIVTMPATIVVLPAVVVSIGSWLAGLGVIGKVVTKFFGETPKD